MNKKHRHRGVALACGALAVLAAGMQAHATPIRFDNPGHDEPGHYHWAEVAPTQGFLDVTLPADQQPVPDPGGPGTYNHPLDPSGNFSSVGKGGPGLGIEVGGLSGVFLVGLDFGQSIPSGLSWASQGFAYHVAHPDLSEIDEGIETYLGVGFDLGAGDQYGWLGVVRTGMELELFAWGYETEPGVSIIAGVPEPGTLAVLVLGGVVLAGCRRRRPVEL